MPRLSPDKSKPLDEERGPEGSIKIEKKVEAAARGKCVLVKREVSFPGFVPEVKGPEDWRAVIRSNQADSPKWPSRGISSSTIHRSFSGSSCL